MNKIEAEALIRELTGLQTPRIGDTIIFTEKGWRFQKPGRVKSPDGSEWEIRVTDLGAVEAVEIE